MPILSLQKTPPTTQLSFKHPSIGLICNALKKSTKPKVLDLGPPSAKTFNFFKAHSSHIRFEGLNSFIELAVSKKPIWSNERITLEMDHYLLPLNKNDKYDIILTWDLFCFLDNSIIYHLCKRLAKNCKNNALLHMVRYWSGRHPSTQCEFKIINQDNITNNYANRTLKYAQKLVPASQLKKQLQLLELTHQFIDTPDMHPAMTESVFSLSQSNTPQNTHKQAANHHLNNKQAEHAKAPLKSHSINLQHASSALGELLIANMANTRSTLNSIPLRILDLGACNTANTNHFANLGHRTFFANLPHIMKHIDLDNTEALPSLLPLRPNQKYDLILGWDLLSSYTPQEIPKIIQLLKPHIHTKSLMHLMHYIGTPNTQLHCTLEHINTCQGAPTKSLDCKINLQQGSDLRSTHSMGIDGSANKIYSIHELARLINAAKIKKSFIFKEDMHPDINEYIIELQNDA